MGIMSVVIIISGAIVVFFAILHERRKRIAARKYGDLLDAYYPKVDAGLSAYMALLESDRYISNHDKFTFTSVYSGLYDDLSRLSIGRSTYKGKAKMSAECFIRNYKNIDSFINERNIEFIERELISQDKLLSNIEGKSLDYQQRNSILTDEDNTLVVAGAGSGKTLTIAGKVKYLIERCFVEPNEILLISFTAKAAEEMRERIKTRMHIDVSVKTFHKLGLDIISKARDEKPSIFSLSQKETLELFASFIAIAGKDDRYSKRMINFLTYYMSKPKTKEVESVEYETLSVSGGDKKSYKIDVGENTTYKLVVKNVPGGKIKYREKVKSYEELLIANFLFTNGIEYAYEERYQYKTASKKFGQYKPDFYLPDYDIYIEHYGIDKDGDVPSWFKGDGDKSAKELYNEGIEWKRREHQRRGTTCVETYSWESTDGELLTNLEKKLKELGVVFNPMTDAELWNYLRANCSSEIDNFTTLVHTFLALVKSNYKTASEIMGMAGEDKRSVAFLDLFWPIYNMYNEYLLSRNEIDFNDMIMMATAEVRRDDFKSHYKYIIVDEFQDISNSRYQLIRALLDKKASTKLFCVGDDWQSIYRFAGSDLGIFVKFEKYFKNSSLAGYNRKTERFLIEKTYRFDNQLIDLSSEFILQNPDQIPKSLKSNTYTDESACTILNYNRDSKIASTLHSALDDIASRANGKVVSIKLLGRYRAEIKELSRSRLKLKYGGSKKPETIITDPNNTNLEISFNTVHSSKGLEADYVILLSGNSGKRGFPTEIIDDPLLNFLLSSSDQYPNGEERRLFYVALTRAKKHVYILSDIESRSKFVEEIARVENLSVPSCDWCGAQLLERKNSFKPGYYYSCANFQTCNFSRKIGFDELYEKANKLFVDNKFQEALISYNKALETNNTSCITYYERGYSYESLGRREEAIKDYTSSISLNNSFAIAFGSRARAYYDLRDYKAAANDWKKAHNLNSQDTSAHFGYIKSQYRLSNYDLTLKLLEDYILKHQNDKDAYLLKAISLRKQGNFQAAHENFLIAGKLGCDVGRYVGERLVF